MLYRRLLALQPGRSSNAVIVPPDLGGEPSTMDRGTLEVWSVASGPLPADAYAPFDLAVSELVAVGTIPDNGFGVPDIDGIRWLVVPIKLIVYWGGLTPKVVRLRDQRDTVRFQALVGAGLDEVAIDNTTWIEGEQVTALTLGYKP